MLCRAEDMSELATVEGSAPDRTNLGRTLKIVGTMVTEALEKASLDSNTKVDTYRYETILTEMTLFTAEDNNGHYFQIFQLKSVCFAMEGTEIEEDREYFAAQVKKVRLVNKCVV